MFDPSRKSKQKYLITLSVVALLCLCFFLVHYRNEHHKYLRQIKWPTFQALSPPPLASDSPPERWSTDQRFEDHKSMSQDENWEDISAEKDSVSSFSSRSSSGVENQQQQQHEEQHNSQQQPLQQTLQQEQQLQQPDQQQQQTVRQSQPQPEQQQPLQPLQQQQQKPQPQQQQQDGMSPSHLQKERPLYTFDDVLRPEARDYLSPINYFKGFIGEDHNPSSDVRRLMADVFRTGYGMTPYVTKDGRQGWMENGVVYQPIIKEVKPYKDIKIINFRKPNEYEYYVPFNRSRFFQTGHPPSDWKDEPKIITWYLPIAYVWRLPKLERMRKCPDFPCRITTNVKYANKSAALVFDGSYLRGDPPPRKNSDQIFVYHHVETPSVFSDTHPYNHPTWSAVFNWTMTWRSDSDIPVYYGLIRKRPTPAVKDYKAIIGNKTKIAATLIGHCKTRGLREKYIEALSEYIKVDIFGNCGNAKCPRVSDASCGDMISSNYKFYFSFENAVCEEYITEKFFRYMGLDVLVVARGGPGYLEHVPPEIFIDASNFETPRHLAKYLIYLDRNPDVYEALLRKKNEYMSLYEEWLHVHANNRVSYVHYHYEAVPFCRMCQWLWNLDLHRKSVPDIGKWHMKRTCNNPTEIPTD